MVAMSAAALAGCGDSDVIRPSIVAAPQIARETLHAPAGGYPLSTCVVCGEKLGDAGNPFIFIHEGVEIRLCNPNCKKEFMADPEKYLGMIRDARAGTLRANMRETIDYPEFCVEGEMEGSHASSTAEQRRVGPGDEGRRA